MTDTGTKRGKLALPGEKDHTYQYVIIPMDPKLTEPQNQPQV